ncbi:uncharacterized protein LOC127724215 [Mytilus californianus]|uniref:uncharacterized protein LOC127724215 n=1 Tax=Mytilus californianus TaxID=6549 RepID=UPI00224704DA|nr:uncharacterized protein LOC127724215 [Mytilus californianus]
MNYVELSAVQKKLDVGKSVSFKVMCEDKSLASVPGGFAVNFQENHDDYANIALQFNPRAKSSKVVLNTRIDKKWEKELYIVDRNLKGVYFGNPFELTINVKAKNQILVSVNGEFKTGYECKVDITAVKYLCYAYGVKIILDD